MEIDYNLGWLGALDIIVVTGGGNQAHILWFVLIRTLTAALVADALDLGR